MLLRGSRLKALHLGKAFLTFLARFPLCLLRWLCICTWAEPAPLTGSFKDLLYLVQFLAETAGGEGGWVVGSPTHPRLQHLVKWLWERVWDFSALGGQTSSVSRRVVKLTVSHYYSAPLPLQKRGYGDEIRNPVVFMIPSTGSGSGVGGRGMHNGCDFGN